jgi:hypothetical protein
MQGTSECSRGNAQRRQKLFTQYFARMDGTHSINCHDATSSVVIDNFNVCWPCLCPYETDTPLIVDSDAALPCPVALQLLQSVARRRAKVSQLNSRMEHEQLPGGDIQDVLPAPGVSRLKQGLGFGTSETQYHALILNVKRYEHTTPQ